MFDVKYKLQGGANFFAVLASLPDKVEQEVLKELDEVVYRGYLVWMQAIRKAPSGQARWRSSGREGGGRVDTGFMINNLDVEDSKRSKSGKPRVGFLRDTGLGLGNPGGRRGSAYQYFWPQEEGYTLQPFGDESKKKINIPGIWGRKAALAEMDKLLPGAMSRGAKRAMQRRGSTNFTRAGGQVVIDGVNQE